MLSFLPPNPHSHVNVLSLAPCGHAQALMPCAGLPTPVLCIFSSHHNWALTSHTRPFYPSPHHVDYLLTLLGLRSTPGHPFLRIPFSVGLGSESIQQATLLCEFPPYSVWALTLYTRLLSYVMNSSRSDILLWGTAAHLPNSHQCSAAID